MPVVFPGRYAAQTQEDFVVFLIGIRINRLVAIRQWLPTVTAMPPMIKELAAQRDKGLMSSKTYLSGRTLLILQYWRSFEDLERFARNPDDFHLPAWRQFNQKVGKSETVGIFHETYLVKPKEHEAVYINMPRFGLARAVEHVPAIGKNLTARRRLGGQNEPAIATDDE